MQPRLRLLLVRYFQLLIKCGIRYLHGGYTIVMISSEHTIHWIVVVVLSIAVQLEDIAAGSTIIRCCRIELLKSQSKVYILLKVVELER